MKYYKSKQYKEPLLIHQKGRIKLYINGMLISNSLFHTLKIQREIFAQLKELVSKLSFINEAYVIIEHYEQTCS